MSKPLKFNIYNREEFVGTKTLSLNVIKIGKLRSSHICLEDEAVARMHAVMEVSDDEVRIIDLGSSSGTFHNGHRIEKNALIENGDILSVGPYRLQVETENDDKPISVTDLPGRKQAPKVDACHGAAIEGQNGDQPSTGPTKTIKNIMLFAREGHEALGATLQAAAWLIDHGVQVWIPREDLNPSLARSRNLLPAACRPIRPEAPPIDVVLALGGDGTLLHAGRWAASQGVPVVGVNLGNLGFLTAFPRDQLQNALSEIVDGSFRVVKRVCMQVRVPRLGDDFQVIALNDAYIKHGDVPRLLSLEASLDNSVMATYVCDGLIVSTPMGSTAYNLAAGGPILDQALQAFAVTPICPHSLTHRPVVVDPKSTLSIHYKGPEGSNAFLTTDGIQVCRLEFGDIVEITRASFDLLIVPPSESAYTVLKAKMGWSHS